MHPLRRLSFWAAVMLGALILLPTLWYYIGGDQALYAYVAWAWQVEGRPPFIGEIPGMYLAHYLVFSLFGAEPFSIRLADYLLQVLNLGLVAWFASRLEPRGKPALAGIISAILYATYYLGLNFGNTVFKDGFVLTPLLLACLILTMNSKRWFWLKACMVGVLLGAAFIFKQTYALAGAAFALLYLAREWRNKSSWGRIVGIEFMLFIFALIPLAWCLFEMRKWGQMTMFLEVYRDYMKQYYLTMGGGYLSSIKYFDYVAFQLFYRSQVLWLGMMLFILSQLDRQKWKEQAENQLKTVLGAMLLVCGLSVFIQAKGLEYHNIPLAGFAAILAGPAFAGIAGLLAEKAGPLWRAALAGLMVLVILALQIASIDFRDILAIKQNSFRPLETAYQNQLEDFKVAKYIAERTRPDDKVLCFGFLLDVNLLARRLAPTDFVYDILLAKPRPVDNQYAPIQRKWQKQLLDDLKQNPPLYFLVDAPPQCVEAKEIDFLELLNRIPDLKNFLEQRYQLETVIGRARIYRLAK